VKLKDWRKRLGLTQAAAAEALGVTRVTFQRLEKMETLDRRTELACAQIELKTVEVYCRWRSYVDGDAGTNRMHQECYDFHSADGGELEYSPYSHERPKKCAYGGNDE